MKIDLVEANSLAGKILFANLLRSMNDSVTDPNSLILAIKPFFALEFGRDMLRGMDAYRFSVILTRLRRSALPADWYQAVVSHVKTFLTDKSEVSPSYLRNGVASSSERVSNPRLISRTGFPS